ncbi:Cell pattern formation-associated protein stuA [Cryomyces minteri]|uniref:Cell pattern formation-associated protein stuA n=1 Tax=Cryomyces minteri TaxID=331657 RepID=A0A4V5NBU9_9PEZI|nr:Cell pattern formation-associated protein stuA [Cryomyces minteri]
MNHAQPYMDVHQSHMSAAQAHMQSSGPPSSLAHYSHYQQLPLMQPGSHSYPPVQSSYGPYGYGNGMGSSAGHPTSSSMGSQMVSQSLPLPAGGPPASGNVPGGPRYPQTFDTTGQVAPHGMKPRVTATLWEDEGSLCFQVEAKGVCVARREDNHMINGTKLLNVAGMTRGRRDGILKSEKTRHVVKIGPMHLKGVWIPFERALDFANKEKITEQLYPLFVHDIGALLYHPTNQTRPPIGGAAVAAAERRRAQDQQQYMRTPQASQPPSLHHHHSMSTPGAPHVSQPPHSAALHPASGRPGLDRAHTFPTPPTSASSLIGMGNSGGSYEWGPAPSAVQSGQPLSIDTGLSNARSVPTTPATTPPGNSIQSMQQYHTTQGYDNSRQMYTAAPSQQGQYSSHASMPRYSQTLQQSAYIKNEMAPPTRAPGESESQPDGISSQVHDHAAGEEEAEHDMTMNTRIVAHPTMAVVHRTLTIQMVPRDRHTKSMRKYRLR